MINRPMTSSSLAQRTVAILAGGASTRMGADKALLILPSGETVLEHIIRVVSQCSNRVIVVGRQEPSPPSHLSSSGGTEIAGEDTEVVFLPDEMPGAGPASALRTALRFSQCPVLLVACDMPGLTVVAVEWLWHEAEAIEARDGVVAVSGDQWEPLFAVYFPACLPGLDRLLSEDRRSLQALLRFGDFATVFPPENLLPVLRNVNTPEQWAEYLATLTVPSPVKPSG